jgi:hypothetical protein
MFEINRVAVDKNLLMRYIALLESDVTVPSEKIATIEAMLEEGSELAMDEAKRLCEEELTRIEESGLCPMGKYTMIADALIQSAVHAIGTDGAKVTNAKAVMEHIAEGTPKEIQEPMIAGMFVGRALAEIEFNAMQMAAMAQAQQMIGSMGLGNIAEMGMELMKGKMPDISCLCKTPKADGLLDRLKNLGQGEGKVDPDDS